MSRNFELLNNVMGEELISAVPPPQETTTPVSVPSEAAGQLASLLQNGPEEVELTNLVQRVFLRPGAAAPRVVGFAAVESGAGCTWVCAHVGRISAFHLAGSVCVVDANLRSPSLHREFRVENEIGLNEALSQNGPIQDYARPLCGNKFWIVGSGSVNAGLDAVTTSERVRSHIASLRNHFDYVLLDLPPLNKYADGVVLGGVCDGIILVVRANRSRRDTALRAVSDLKAANIRLLGVTLNQRTFEIPSAIYHRL